MYTYTVLLISQIQSFLETGEIPEELPRSSGYKFKARYGDGSFTVENDQVLHEGRLVVAQEEADELLAELYEDPLYKQTSAVRFHNRVSSEYDVRW